MQDENNANNQTFECFVSMPFSTDFDDVYLQGISGITDHLKKFRLDLVRLDKEAYRRRHIEDNVLKHIDLSDLVIADISQYQDTLVPNVSVMHEVGYACGKQIPFILIGKKDAHSHLPGNLKGSLVIEYDIDTDREYKSFSRHLAQQVIKTVEEEVINKVRGDYRADCFLERNRIGLPRLIEMAHRRIFILTTNLEYTERHLKDSILKALDNNKSNAAFKIEILTMDPESDVANARAVQLSRAVRVYRNELRKSLDDMRSSFADNTNVEIVTYSTLPTQMTFIIDDLVVTAIVSLGQQSREGVHFVMNKLPEVTESFLAHFRVLKMLAVAAPSHTRG